MHMVRTIVGMQYMAEFSCLGGRCETDCCTEGFNIPYSRSDYEELERVSAGSDVMRSRVLSAFDMDVPAGFFAFLKMNENGLCPFLSSDKLCEIHASFGDGAIGSVCRTYPRVINVMGDRAEVSGTLSCPEVARRLFLGLEPMKFITFKREDLPPGMLHYEKVMASEDVAIVDAMREFSVRILSLERYALSSRLYCLATFAEKIGCLNLDGQSDSAVISMREIFDRFIDKANIDKCDHIIQNIRINSIWPLDFMSKLINDKSKGSNSKACKKWLEIYTYKNDSYMNKLELFVNWQKMVTVDLRTYLDHLITIYLYNYVISKPPEGISDIFHYIQTLITFGMLVKFILITKTAEMPVSGQGTEAYINCKEALSEMFVIEISRFSRYFEHELHYQERMKQCFAELNSKSLAHLVMIIKSLA